jgi:hypothetical protein
MRQSASAALMRNLLIAAAVRSSKLGFPGRVVAAR